MVATGYLMTIGIFMLYYFLVLFGERKLLKDPKDIISKFLSIILLYGGVSIIYFSFTGKPFLDDSMDNYNLYIFMMGFIAIIWTVPNLLIEFGFFRNFLNKRMDKKELKKMLMNQD